MWTVEFHIEAEEELAAATDWYAERNLAAAIAFAAEVREGVGSILRDPSRLPTLGPELHFYLLKRFPYLLPYRIADTTIRILEAIREVDLRGKSVFERCLMVGWG